MIMSDKLNVVRELDSGRQFVQIKGAMFSVSELRPKHLIHVPIDDDTRQIRSMAHIILMVIPYFKTRFCLKFSYSYDGMNHFT